MAATSSHTRTRSAAHKLGTRAAHVTREPRGHNSLRDSTSADKKRIIMEEQKALGNAEFKAGNYEKAIGFFTKAIELEANHVLYSNRSACHCALKEYDSAAADAEKCIGMKADWGKGYARKGAALHGLGQFDASIAAYEEGLKVEPGLEMLKKGLADAQGAAAAPAAASTASPTSSARPTSSRGWRRTRRRRAS